MHGRARMYVFVAGYHSPLSIALALSAVLWSACGGGGEDFVKANKTPDQDAAGSGATGMSEGPDGEDADEDDRACDYVEVDGDLVIERETDFTARYRAGDPYEKTVMLFGGESVEDQNALSNAYIFGLDKVDAVMLAQQYPDFYLCSSEGGMAASEFILSYDLIPASCEIFDQIVEALRVYHRNVASGGDRTSLRLEGAPLQLESVTDNGSRADVTDQVEDQTFHLVTSVEQLTGESVISFGMK